MCAKHTRRRVSYAVRRRTLQRRLTLWHIATREVLYKYCGEVELEVEDAEATCRREVGARWCQHWVNQGGLYVRDGSPSLDWKRGVLKLILLHVNRVLAQAGRTCKARLGAPRLAICASGRGAAPLESRSKNAELCEVMSSVRRRQVPRPGRTEGRIPCEGSEA